MSGAIAMIELTPEAEARLAEYLRQVRAALAGSADVNADEIEADIREHVDNELHRATAPVGVARLEAVLDQLGPPAKWGGAESPSLFQGLRRRLRLGERLRVAREAVWRGPEDWRLAYLAFGVLAIGMLTVVAFPIFLVLAYILGRSGIALAREKGIELGAARKWLLYPPVVMVSAALLVGVVAWPIALGGIVHEEVEVSRNRIARYYAPHPLPTNSRDMLADFPAKREYSNLQGDFELLAAIPVPPVWAPAAAGIFVGAGAVAIWWTVLGLIAARFPGAVRAAFLPFANRFECRHGFYLALPCLALAIAWCVAAWEIAAVAGTIG